MAKLTRKLWVGIGAATIVGASFAGAARGRKPTHKGHEPAPPAAGKGARPTTPTQGGEAYLTDGGPRDTRIRFYRDIALMRGHLLVGGQLIELGLWDEALPHFLHPTEELYGVMEKYIKLHNIRPFQPRAAGAGAGREGQAQGRLRAGAEGRRPAARGRAGRGASAS